MSVFVSKAVTVVILVHVLLFACVQTPVIDEYQAAELVLKDRPNIEITINSKLTGEVERRLAAGLKGKGEPDTAAKLRDKVAAADKNGYWLTFKVPYLADDRVLVLADLIVEGADGVKVEFDKLSQRLPEDNRGGSFLINKSLKVTEFQSYKVTGLLAVENGDGVTIHSFSQSIKPVQKN